MLCIFKLFRNRRKQVGLRRWNEVALGAIANYRGHLWSTDFHDWFPDTRLNCRGSKRVKSEKFVRFLTDNIGKVNLENASTFLESVFASEPCCSCCSPSHRWVALQANYFRKCRSPPRVFVEDVRARRDEQSLIWSQTTPTTATATTSWVGTSNFSEGGERNSDSNTNT